MNFTTLKQLTIFVKRGISPKYVEDGGVIVLNQKCIREGRVSLKSSRLTDKNFIYPQEKQLLKGDTLVNSTGTGTVGRTAPFRNESVVYADSHITIVRPNQKKIYAIFLSYKLRSMETILEGMAKGATNQVELSANKMREMEISYPSRRRQEFMADVLSTYDELIENNRRRMQLLEEAARLLYREWFVHLRFPGHEHMKMVDGVPEGWKRSSISTLTSFLKRGITPSYDDDAQGIVINQKCIRDGRINMNLARNQSKEVKEERRVQSGDVLVNSTGEGTLGRVAQAKLSVEHCTVDSHVTIVRPSHGIHKHWFGLAVMEWEPRFSTMGKGATNQTELSPAAIGETKIVVPSESLRNQFELFADPIYRQVTTLVVQNDKLTEARDLLLPRLMSGEITI